MNELFIDLERFELPPTPLDVPVRGTGTCTGASRERASECLGPMSFLRLVVDVERKWSAGERQAAYPNPEEFHRFQPTTIFYLDGHVPQQHIVRTIIILLYNQAKRRTLSFGRRVVRDCNRRGKDL